jgi:hypothetical protein
MPTTKTLSQQLVTDGLSQQQADVLEIAFGQEPGFLDGMTAVVAVLAMDECPDYAPPESRPWCDIWDEIQRAPADKDKIFLEQIAQFPDDVRDTLETVINTKVQNKRIWLAGLGSGNSHNKTPEYYMSILSNLGYSFRFNMSTITIEVNGKPINDYIAAGIRAKARAAGVSQVSSLEDAYQAYAWAHKYNPVQKYLEHLKFDGGDPISELAEFFTDDKKVFEMFLRRWLIGAVARVFRGTRNRVFVLDGVQHIGKSAFARWLGSPMIEYFKEGPILPDDKDCRLALLRTWIWEVSEWGTVARRQDREALKAFITTIEVQDRAAYGRYATTGQAMSSFIATANNEMGLFNDPTGTTRYMTAHILAIDWKGYTQKIDVDQVWAQAMDLYLNGEKWELSPAEEEIAKEINNDYQMVDIVEETINRLYEITPGSKLNWKSSIEIMETLKDPQRGNLKVGTEIDIRKMSSALTKLGLEKPIQRRVTSVPGGASRLERGYWGVKEL